MSRFYTTAQGDSRRGISRTGNRSLNSHSRTWNHGIEVVYLKGVGNSVKCEVYLTGGSNNPERVKKIYSGETLGENVRPGSIRYGSPIGGGK